MMEKGLLTAIEAGEILGVCREYLYKLVKAGEIKAVKIGKRGIRFKEEDLRAFVESRTTGSARQ